MTGAMFSDNATTTNGLRRAYTVTTASLFALSIKK